CGTLARNAFFCSAPQNFAAWHQKPAPGAKVSHAPPSTIRKRVSISQGVRLHCRLEKIDWLKFTGEGVGRVQASSLENTTRPDCASAPVRSRIWQHCGNPHT